MSGKLPAWNWRRRMLLLGGCAMSTAMAGEELAPDPWLGDLRTLLAELPRQHANAFRWTTRAQFEQLAIRLEQELPGLDGDAKAVKLAELVAGLRDGHSFIQGYFPLLGFSPRTYPIRLYDFADGIHVQAAARSHEALLGMRLVRINSRPVRDVFALVSRVFPAENEMAEKAWAVYGLTAPEVLRAFGVIERSGAAVFEFEGANRTLEVDFSGTERDQPRERFGQVLDSAWLPARRIDQRALRRRQPESPYWYEFDTPTGLLFVQFNEIRNSGQQGVLAFFDEVARVAASRPVQRFVLDMRCNAGGETGMNSDIVKTLLASPVINRKDRFFVLIGRRTFSSAQLVCTALEQYSHAVFVGEMTATRTHFFANTRRLVVLNHSGLNVFLSTAWWQPTNAKDLRVGQQPQIAVAERFEDFAMDRDRALMAALAHPVEARL